MARLIYTFDISNPHPRTKCWDQSHTYHYHNGSYTDFIPAMRYGDVIMGAIASQITSLTIVCSTVYSDADQRKHQSSVSLAFVWEIHRDRWISRTNGQYRGNCFHLMTSSLLQFKIASSILIQQVVMVDISADLMGKNSLSELHACLVNTVVIILYRTIRKYVY